jgi:cyclic pyranopterin phosphate synthase
MTHDAIRTLPHHVNLLLKLVRFKSVVRIEKGDVLTVAKIAGIQAAKQTANLIPLCHPLLLDRIDVKLNLTEQGVTAQSDVRCVGRTGVEMEAMVAVSAALLTVYDMCKAVDKEMEITGIHLLKKVKENV